MGEVVDVLLRARGDFSDLTGKISGLRKEFQNLKLPKDIAENLEKSFNRLDPILKSYQKQLDKGFKTKADIKNFNAIRTEMDTVLGDLNSEIQKINGKPIQLKADLKEINALEKKLDNLGKQLQTKLDNITIGKGGKVAEEIDKLISATNKAASIKPMTARAQDFFNKQDFVAFNAEIDKVRDKILSLSNKSGAKIDLARSLGFKGSTIDKDGKEIASQIEKIDTLINKFFNSLKVSDSSLTGLEKTKRDITQTGEALGNLKTDSLTRGAKAIATLGQDAEQASKSAKELGNSISDTGSNVVRMSDELSQLQTSTQYFFSLRNMINLFKRGVREAVDTVKELDAAMTETAVVTNYSVSDMWAKLPEYTANAKALGSTIQQMYEATTLYYQQGLNDSQAMGIANETMKMARIGGLEAADATDKMTAALRGFNMEINETSAQRVNDVYSNLAAKTASNTEELGTAMQRTASIAASAGMSFEGTAAFLAQAIETTREPAENLGTAMKTIVARFTELKKNPLEISEVDGEEVDYNKVDAALKSIGVSLKDTNGQFRALDEVFLDISQRWDSLTQTQQRYVATQAAGSRQQSRFIAMMSNYERTMELMDYANNSAGASTEQFNKTMDSLEAKLNIFKDTWQEFLMGIANEGVIKKVVGGANLALTTLNKIIDTISKVTGPVEGLTKSALSLGVAFFGLRSFGRLANGMIRGFGGMLDPSTSFGEQFKLGVLNSRNSLQAAAISNPIVNAIRELHPLINKAAAHSANQNGAGNLKGAQAALNEELYNSKATLLNGKSVRYATPKYTPQTLLDIIGANNLTPIQQKHLFDRNPGLKKNLKKSLGNLLEEVGADKKTKEQLVKGLASGSMPLEDILNSPTLKKTWGEQYQEIIDKYGKDAYKNGGEGRAAINDLKKRAGVTNVKALKEGGELYNTPGDEYRSSTQAWLSQSQELNAREQIMQKIANNAQKISGGMMGIGTAFSMVGSIVGESNEELGKMLTNIGAITTAVGAFGMAFSTFMNMNPILLGISLAIGAVIGAATVFKKHINDIKKAGEEVVDTYKEINSTTQENISTLKSYQEQTEYWSKGVDEFGNNVNLSDEEYAAYQDAVSKIAEINPGIVEGYNAQGKAIVDINEALKETIRLETQRQKKAQEDYTNVGSLDKLIRARNANKDYRNAYAISKATLSHLQGQNWSGISNWIDDTIFQPFMKSNFGYSFNKKILGNDYLNVSKTNKGFGVSLGPFETILDNFNSQKDKWWNKEFFAKNGFDINFEALSDATNEGHARAVRQFIDLQDQIYAAASAEEELSEATKKSFDNLKEQSEAYKASFEEVLINLQTFASSLPGYADLSSEMRQAISVGLEEIAADPELTAKQMQKQTTALVSELDKLTGAGTAYSYVMEEVVSHQQQFADDLNEAAYFKNIEDDLADLDTLMKQYEKDTTAYGRAVYEFLSNQKASIKDFTTSGEEILASSINEMSGVLAEAESAYENFQNATKTDYSTGKNSLKSIYDELFKETDGIQLHLEGKGDQTLWQGAESLLGREYVETHGYKDVINALKKLGPYLEEGQQGFDNFWNAFMQIDPDKIDGLEIDKEKGTYKIEDSKAEEVYKEIAKTMEMGESFLVAMLNAGRQYASINFTNDEKVRKALATDESVIKGKDGTLFTTNDYLNTALSEGGITVPQEQEKWKEEHQKEVGLVTIDNLDELSDKNLEQMGITDMRSAIETLGKTGLFGSEQIEEVAKKFSDYNPEDYQGAWKQYLDRQADPTLAPIESIESNVASIASSIKTNDIAEGKITQTDLDKAAHLKEVTLGGVGVDTAVQYFGQGLNEYGNALTADQYRKGKENLEQGLEYAEQMKNAFQKAADNATNEEDRQKYQEAANNYDSVYKSYQNNLEAVDRNYAEAYAEYQKGLATERYMANGKSLTEAEAAAQEVYQKAFQDATDFIKNGGIGDLSETVYTDEEAKSENKPKSSNATSVEQPEINTQLQSEWNSLLASQWSEAFNSLDLSAIAQDDKLSSALHNVFQAINEGVMPDESDINTLGITEAWGNIGKEYEKSIHDSVEDTNASVEHGIERAESHDEQTNSTGEQAGENAYNKYSKSIEHGIERAEQHDKKNTPSPSPTPSTSPTSNMPMGVFKAEERDSKIKVGAEVDEPALEKAKELMVEVQGLAEQGATFAITTIGTDNLKKAANSAKTLTNNVGDKQVAVTAEVTGKDKVNELKGAIDDLNGKKVTVNIKHSGLTASNIIAIDTAINGLNDKEVTITVKKKGVNDIDGDGRPPYTGGYITSAGVIYRAKGGIAEYPGYPKKGTDRIPAYLTPGEYVQNRKAVQYFGIDFMRKINHQDLIGALQSFGSVAKGKYGQLGPKGKGGLTLTGELGYEIAWLPDENRSVILGANGPQMVNLPRNAVVYNHEQSKDIMKKQKNISAGSMHGGNYKPGEPKKVDKDGKVVDKDKDKDDKRRRKNTDDAAKVIKKAGKISAWWWNMGKKVEATQRIIDKTYKKIDKLIDKAGTTLDDISKDGELYIDKLQQQISLNTKMKKKAEKGLTTLDQGTKYNKKATAAQKKVKAAEKKLKKAKKTKSKKDDKEARQELKKAKRDLKKAKKLAKKKGGINYATISYDKTIQKGKKKTKKPKKEKINLSPYIKYNKATGAYVIDEAKINKQKWDKSKKKAVMEAAQKKLEDKVDKKNTAEDKIDDAKEKLLEYGEQLYEAFHGWENELTKIYFLTQQIAEMESRVSALKSMESLQENRLLSGLQTLTEQFKKESLAYFQGTAKGTVRNLENRNQLIDIKRQDLIGLVQAKAQKEDYIKLSEQLKTAKDPQEILMLRAGLDKLGGELKAINLAQKYINPLIRSDGTIDLQFKAEKFNEDRMGSNPELNTASAEIIQKYIKDIEEGNQDLLSMYEEQISGLNELYESLTSLQQKYADYSEELLKAIEDEAQERVDKIKGLSDAISDNFKELIDNVKSRLEERRQQEDNSKTERDIIKKQNRLALLRANSAGGNVVAAAQLEQEIADAQQSYGRTLEDQLLDKLQNSSDKAEKQRERQIELANAMLELNKINGTNVALVSKYLGEPERYQTRIVELIKDARGYNTATEQSRAILDGQIKTMLADLDRETGIPRKIEDVKDEIGRAENAVAQALANFAMGAAQQTGVDTSSIMEGIDPTEPIEEDSELDTKLTKAEAEVKYKEALLNAEKNKKTSYKEIHETLMPIGKATGRGAGTILKELAATPGITWEQILRALKGHYSKYRLAYTFDSDTFKKAYDKVYGDGQYKKNRQYAADHKKDYPKYAFAAGGLANYTGPAWLDGTPSKPELVLNSTDTKNLIALKDVLSKVMKGSLTTTTENQGDILYEININVDKIEKDYDVDQVVDKVKKEIVKSAGYRNVTQVRNFR